MSNFNLNIIKGVLAIVVLFLGYKLYRSIQDEIDFTANIAANEEQVKISLDRIRIAQTAYRDVNNHFAKNKDVLVNFLKYGQMRVTKEYGDPDDSTSQYIVEVKLVPVSDEILVGYDYDSLFSVPHQPDTFFTMSALIITQNKVEVPVFKVFDPVPFNPNRQEKGKQPPLAVGSLTEATYSGNWK
jgi:hypothetical protein